MFNQTTFKKMKNRNGKLKTQAITQNSEELKHVA